MSEKKRKKATIFFHDGKTMVVRPIENAVIAEGVYQANLEDSAISIPLENILYIKEEWDDN